MVWVHNRWDRKYCPVKIKAARYNSGFHRNKKDKK